MNAVHTLEHSLEEHTHVGLSMSIRPFTYEIACFCSLHRSTYSFAWNSQFCRKVLTVLSHRPAIVEKSEPIFTTNWKPLLSINSSLLFLSSISDTQNRCSSARECPLESLSAKLRRRFSLSETILSFKRWPFLALESASAGSRLFTLFADNVWWVRAKRAAIVNLSLVSKADNLPFDICRLCEAESAYNDIACSAIHDMLNARGDKVLPVIPHIILPMKRGESLAQ